MIPAIHASALPPSDTAGELFAAAATAGFEAVELLVSEQGPISFDASAGDLRELHRCAAGVGVSICALGSGTFWECNYGSSESAVRMVARDRTLRMLDAARAVGAATIVVIPAVVGRAAERQARVGYADALHRTFDALWELRFEAESRGVVLTMENCWSRFLLSPVEACDLIDRVNSPWVGWCLDTGNVLASGYPEDWIAVLGRRIRAVHAKDYQLDRPGREGFCRLGEGSVNWPLVLSELRRFGYEGPLTYEGPRDAGASERMRSILKGDLGAGRAAS